VTVSPDMVAGDIFALLARGRNLQASDLHLEPRQGAAYRILTRVQRIDGYVPSASEIAAFIDCTLDRRSRARLDKVGLADGAYADDRVGPVRIHASRGRHGPRLAIRILARSIPELETLRLPPVVNSFAASRSGMYLVAGPPGSGKTTTISAILDLAIATTQRHAVVFEDPLEYAFTWQRGIVTAYEVGRDVASFGEGIRGALRADPDVIFVGELRGLDAMSAALQAAETGHVLIAAIHSPTESSVTINRIIGLFPAEEQEAARHRLSDALRAIVGLRLLPLKDGSGLRAAAEVVVVNDAVRRLIRDGSTHQLRSYVTANRRDGSQTLESHLGELVAAGEIDLASARAASLFPEEVRPDGRSR